MTVTQPHPPAYAAGENETSFMEEKQRDIPQGHHNDGTASQTPKIDEQLSRPAARSALLSLSSAFAAAAEEDRDLKAVVQSVVPDMSAWMQDIKKQKKNGEISKEDKKELKKEMKWLFKDVKKDVKASWKTKS